MDEVKQFILDSLERRRGDDLARARRVYAGMGPVEMGFRYDEHCLTRAEILKQCEDHEACVDAAIAWVNTQYADREQ